MSRRIAAILRAAVVGGRGMLTIIALAVVFESLLGQTVASRPLTWLILGSSCTAAGVVLAALVRTLRQAPQTAVLPGGDSAHAACLAGIAVVSGIAALILAAAFRVPLLAAVGCGAGTIGCVAADFGRTGRPGWMRWVACAASLSALGFGWVGSMALLSPSPVPGAMAPGSTRAALVGSAVLGLFGAGWGLREVMRTRGCGTSAAVPARAARPAQAADREATGRAGAPFWSAVLRDRMRRLTSAETRSGKWRHAVLWLPFIGLSFVPPIFSIVTLTPAVIRGPEKEAIRESLLRREEHRRQFGDRGEKALSEFEESVLNRDRIRWGQAWRTLFWTSWQAALVIGALVSWALLEDRRGVLAAEWLRPADRQGFWNAFRWSVARDLVPFSAPLAALIVLVWIQSLTSGAGGGDVAGLVAGSIAAAGIVIIVHAMAMLVVVYRVVPWGQGIVGAAAVAGLLAFTYRTLDMQAGFTVASLTTGWTPPLLLLASGLVAQWLVGRFLREVEIGKAVPVGSRPSQAAVLRGSSAGGGRGVAPPA